MAEHRLKFEEEQNIDNKDNDERSGTRGSERCCGSD